MTRAQDKDSRFKRCEGSDTGAGRPVVPFIDQDLGDAVDKSGSLENESVGVGASRKALK